MRKLIQGGTIVNEGRSFTGSLVIEDDCIAEIIDGTQTPHGTFDETVNAMGCFVLPGVIDDHVHFRERGLTLRARAGQLPTVVSRPISRCRTPFRRRQHWKLCTTNGHVQVNQVM